MRRLLRIGMVSTMLLGLGSIASAQTQPANDQTTTTRTDDRDHRGNWGWIGLLGLVGLFGLRRRDVVETRTHTTAASPAR